MDRVIILDADMASAFAKIKRLELLKRLFSKHRIVITPEIYEENGVETIGIYSILRSLRESGLQSKEEVMEIITAIEKKDNTKIKDVDAVFR
ncbi:MAG: hypothetical protein U9N01_03205 [Euryarchaeota archaeon]|nr:hypothetical protein [Euryarchaeota archaeon]